MYRMYSTPYPFLKCALQFCGCRLTAEEASAAAATNIIDKKNVVKIFS